MTDRNRQWPLLQTLDGTYKRAVEENLGISKNALRDLVLSGTIPSICIGESKRTRLINFEILRSFLYSWEVHVPQAPEPGQIRKINV